MYKSFLVVAHTKICSMDIDLDVDDNVFDAYLVHKKYDELSLSPCPFAFKTGDVVITTRISIVYLNYKE